MRSLALSFAACVVLQAGFSYGEPTLVTRKKGTTLNMAALTFNAIVEQCYLKTPQGMMIQFTPIDESNDKYKKIQGDAISHCRVQLNDIDANDNGLWTIVAVSTGGIEHKQTYQLTVTPDETGEASTPALDPPAVDITVETLPHEYINTRLGKSHTVFIRDYGFITSEKCDIITPSGIRYDVQKLNLPNIEAVEHGEARCAVKINVSSEDDVGNWTLLAEGSRYSDDITRSLPFTIHVEEVVVPSQDDIVVVEGNDVYIRLRHPARDYDTCRLMGPDIKDNDAYEIDKRYTTSCGYVIRNVQSTDSGLWEITYGKKIIYKAFITITVLRNAADYEELINVGWIRDRPVNVTLGAENATYCEIKDPKGLTVYDGFGRCKVVIDRVTSEHVGTWKMNVGLPGRVLTQNSHVIVSVSEAAPKPLVETEVTVNRPFVSFKCKVLSPHPLRLCKFRDPSGRILLANEGIGESRYKFHGSGVSYQSGIHTHDCGLTIENPVVEELGLWRCAVETEEEHYYGFLRVYYFWAIRDPEVAAAIVTEPTLRPDRFEVSTFVGESVAMSCSIQSPIRYCYFRARNGTVFNVGPGQQHDQATYVGAGFDAGECGIKFPSLDVSDSGVWSCHVGDMSDLGDRRARIDVSVQDAMVADQRKDGKHMIVEAQVQYSFRQLDYCRFVRIDGLGFNSEFSNLDYSNLSDLSRGRCAIKIEQPSILDKHPWTVVAKVRGQEVELSRVTQGSLENPVPPPGGSPVYYHLPVAWIVVMAVGLSMVLLGVLIGPKSNRRWTYERANAIRNSFIKKKVEQHVQSNNNDKTTAVAA